MNLRIFRYESENFRYESENFRYDNENFRYESGIFRYKSETSVINYYWAVFVSFFDIF
mgnify:CR=1 FL=1